MKRLTPNQITVIVTTAAVAVLGTLIGIGLTQSDAPKDGGTVLRADSHRLAPRGSSDVVVVEFLDFECEACGAAYPFIEQLREQYRGQVTFVTRYFPLPSHRNGRAAAHAAEAAARQDRYEEMYERLFTTQAEWGESGDSKAALFRSYADDLGLDMAQYDRDVDSDEVEARVQKDVDDGTALGVQGTPAFFVDGRRLEVASADDFTRAIDQALAE